MLFTLFYVLFIWFNCIHFLCSYVDFIRVKGTSAGSKMDALKKYVVISRASNIFFRETSHLSLCSGEQKVTLQMNFNHLWLCLSVCLNRFSCDIHVEKLMRERSLGNSVSMLYHKLCEQHSEDWMERSLQYLTVCHRFQGTTMRPVTPPPTMSPVPTAKWLLYVHAEDVRSRYGELKARVTSVFGSILKMDSTKKVTC